MFYYQGGNMSALDVDLGFDPESFRPKTTRLVVAVRGPAGVGKSHMAASLADAGLGRLCVIGTEGKTRLLPGYGQGRFDAYEVPHDKLLPFVRWAITKGKKEKGWNCFVLAVCRRERSCGVRDGGAGVRARRTVCVRA